MRPVNTSPRHRDSGLLFGSILYPRKEESNPVVNDFLVIRTRLPFSVLPIKRLRVTSDYL